MIADEAEFCRPLYCSRAAERVRSSWSVLESWMVEYRNIGFSAVQNAFPSAATEIHDMEVGTSAVLALATTAEIIVTPEVIVFRLMWTCVVAGTTQHNCRLDAACVEAVIT